jgi:nitrile hydratase
MNGIHDMGGMHGMGPIDHEQNEPVFHEEWEGRVYAITRLLRAGGGRQNLDNSRYLIELLPPAMVPAMVVRRNSARRSAAVKPRFKAGQRVRARNINPTGHTRLPRYARGKQGIVHLDHGVFVFPDTNAQFLGEKPQHLYSVRFMARELWGDQASARDFIHLDMWDDYLDHA